MSKHILRWGIILVMIITIVFTTNSISLNSSTSDIKGSEDADIIEEVIFPHDEVVDVNISIDEENLAAIYESPLEEEYYEADIKYNGYTVTSVAIRTKGNSSLSQVASSDSERYSLKVDFNYYVSNQSLLGITKLNLNNIFSDNTLMAEYLGYEMLESIDAEASRTTYVALSINGEYQGLYLSVEEVNESYLTDHFDDNDGALYKPNMGVGSDLVYTTDDINDYTDVVDRIDSNDDGSDFIDFVKEIQNVIDGDGDLDKVMNVDSFLKYLAVSTASIHLDTYQSGMNHNYYLYNYDGVFEWIAWDLNMIFNGFPRANLTQEEAMNFLIDEPVIGSMDDYELIQAIFMNEEYVESYHLYLEELINGYLEEETFESKVLNTYELIKSYASIDPTAFAEIEVVEETLFVSTDTTLSLLDFISTRVESMNSQLSGEIPSTNDGLGNSGSGTSGDMQKGMGQGQIDGERPTGVDGEMPEGMEAPTGVDGEMPEGMEPPADGEAPEGMDGQTREKPDGMAQDQNQAEVEVVVNNPVDSIGVIASVSALMVIVIAFIKRR